MQTSGRPVAAETVLSVTGDRELARRRPLFDVCALLGMTALMCAIGFRRIELLGVGAPFLVAVAASLASWHPVDGTVRLRLDTTRVLEGAELTITVEVHSHAGLGRVELELFPSDRLAGVGILRAVTTVRPDSTAELSFTVRASEWGVGRIQKLTVRVSDRFAMFGGEMEMRPDHPITIELPEDRISASLDAERFRRIVGSHLSNDRGQGLEIADIRRFQPGDSRRQINWRISNRRGEPWVTLRHPDRSTTVVVIVDAHDGDSDEQRVTQRRSVSAALALSRGHLAMHDRVGLLVVGHTLQWLPPRLGRNQLFEIADHLVAVSNAPEASLRMYRPPAISAIPTNAVVVAVSPLRDPLMVALVGEIRGRGNPVSVLMPESTNTRNGGASPGAHISRRILGLQTRVDAQAQRLAQVEQRIGVQSLRDRGVAVVPWYNNEPVVNIIESIQQLRNAMSRARAR